MATTLSTIHLNLTVYCTSCYAGFTISELDRCYDKAVAMSEKAPVLLCPNCGNLEFIIELQEVEL